MNNSRAMASDQFDDQKDPSQRRPPKLSDEEVKILKECENESFFRRALPLSCGAFLGAQYLVRSGKLARHPRFGALPKSIIAGGLAYLAGKISYLPECRRKILDRIPDSSLAMQIKKGRAGMMQDPASGQRETYIESYPGGNYENPDRKSKYSSDKPSYEGLNDSHRPSLDNEVKVRDEEEKKKSITYEDLRQHNRQKYKDNLASPDPPNEPGAPSYKDSPYMPQKTWPDRTPDTPPQDNSGTSPPSAPPKRKRTNMWGDVIED